MENVDKITYTSSKKSVVTVNKNGKITAKKKGTAKVKAVVTLKDGTKKTVTMKVKVKQLNSYYYLSLIESPLVLQVGTHSFLGLKKERVNVKMYEVKNLIHVSFLNMTYNNGGEIHGQL